MGATEIYSQQDQGYQLRRTSHKCELETCIEVGEYNLMSLRPQGLESRQKIMNMLLILFLTPRNDTSQFEIPLLKST